jgi:hypothetical protein
VKDTHTHLQESGSEEEAELLFTPKNEVNRSAMFTLLANTKILYL